LSPGRKPSRSASPARETTAGEKKRRRIRSSPQGGGKPPALDRAAVSRVARVVEILSIDLLGAHFERADDDPLPRAVTEPNAPDVAIGVEWKIDDDQGLLGCVLTFGTVFDRRKAPYTLIARFRLLYQVNPDERLRREELEQFAHWNAMFNAWPYWREHVSSTINGAHLPQFVVPVMRVPMPDGRG